MDRQQIGLKLGIAAIGLPFRLQTFDDRLILQKAVCLLQAAGVNLGYQFSWYLRGPYSPGLTKDAFGILDELDQDDDSTTGWTLDEGSVETANKLKPIFERRTDRSKLAVDLELLASICYLLNRRFRSVGSVDQLKKILHGYDKQYDNNEINAGLTELKQHGLWSGQFS